ncbi:hypothetical protein ETTORE_0380 [Pseudomonas phage Ettore]|nr:hypothetical protein Deiofobo_0374 [Pseudomonas phage Deifobo]WPK40089.1 hypothetical protein ETTORE_0380 [Pseudomonas phage Ettore]
MNNSYHPTVSRMPLVCIRISMTCANKNYSRLHING